MAQWGAPFPTSLPLIPSHRLALVRDRNRFSPFSTLKLRR